MSGRDPLAERLAAAQDERRRLAELLHDGPVQQLAAIAQMLSAAEHALATGDADGSLRILTRASTVTRDANADLRELVEGIEPPALSQRGFAEEVHQLADRMRARPDIRLELDVDAGDGLGDGAQLGLYQIVREALDEAARRGPPTRISVTVRETANGGAELVVADDGAAERRRAVIDGLAERASTLNGELAVEQSAGGGTTVRIVVPHSTARR